MGFDSLAENGLSRTLHRGTFRIFDVSFVGWVDGFPGGRRTTSGMGRQVKNYLPLLSPLYAEQKTTQMLFHEGVIKHLWTTSPSVPKAIHYLKYKESCIFQASDRPAFQSSNRSIFTAFLWSFLASKTSSWRSKLVQFFSSPLGFQRHTLGVPWDIILLHMLLLTLVSNNCAIILYISNTSLWKSLRLRKPISKISWVIQVQTTWQLLPPGLVFPLTDSSLQKIMLILLQADSYRYTTAGAFSKPFHFIDAEDNPPTSESPCVRDFNVPRKISNWQTTCTPKLLCHMVQC